METLLEVMRSLWTIWLFGLFAAIVIWVYRWADRRRLNQDYASIPLDDEPPQAAHVGRAANGAGGPRREEDQGDGTG